MIHYSLVKIITKQNMINEENYSRVNKLKKGDAYIYIYIQRDVKSAFSRLLTVYHTDRQSFSHLPNGFLALHTHTSENALG